MNVLACLGSEALCTHGSSATGIKRRQHTQHSKAIHSQSQGQWQWQWQRKYWGRKRVTQPLLPPLHATGKGFGSRGGSSAAAEQYRRREERGEERWEESEENNAQEDDDAIPEVVFERMLRRIVFFVVSPMALGIGVLYVLGVVKGQGVWEAPVWLQLITILLAFGTSSLGLAYGTLSTNWDPDAKGSLLGWEEAQKNWLVLWKESSAGKKS